MARADLNDIAAFLAVAREGGFTKAAARLGVSQSAPSQTLRNLEARSACAFCLARRAASRRPRRASG